MKKSYVTMTNQTIQRLREKGTEAWNSSFSPEQHLNAVQKHTDTTGTTFRLLGVTCPYVSLSCYYAGQTKEDLC